MGQGILSDERQVEDLVFSICYLLSYEPEASSAGRVFALPPLRFAVENPADHEQIPLG